MGMHLIPMLSQHDAQVIGNAVIFASSNQDRIVLGLELPIYNCFFGGVVCAGF